MALSAGNDAQTLRDGERASCTVILGAGFSSMAGVPLGKDLFDVSSFVTSRSADDRFKAVWRAWDDWNESHPREGPEQFLHFLYQSAIPPVPFPWAVELIGAAIATQNSDDRLIAQPRYAQRLTTPVHCAAHGEFWRFVLNRFQLKAVVTTNYDILVERGLRHRRIKDSSSPGIYYGGLPRPQVLQGHARVGTNRNAERNVELAGSIPVFKLHGSLNWATEGTAIQLYLDLRPSFRYGGQAAIIPPLPHKRIPRWLHQVWSCAQCCLESSDVWLVCGYSLPEYDLAIRDILATAAKRTSLEEIILLDPTASTLTRRWQALAPGAELTAMAGLPHGIHQLEGRSTVA